MVKHIIFWQKAAQSLPAPYRLRYEGYFERAERWELAYDGFLQMVARIKSVLHMPGPIVKN
jgi:hypothetical protein